MAGRFDQSLDPVDQWYKTSSHSYDNHQAQVRYVTKLRFMIGLAQRAVEMIGSAGSPQVQISMGELAALESIWLLLAHEANAQIKDGILWARNSTMTRRATTSKAFVRPSRIWNGGHCRRATQQVGS
jgi:aromatic ring hydroxylase